jgi:FkbM family methyltransferase
VLKSFTVIGLPLEGIIHDAILKMRGFSYDPKRNGEHELIRKLSDAWREQAIAPQIFDVGANTGNWTNFVLIIAKNLNPRVHTFEINQDLCNVLKNRFESDSRVVPNSFGLHEQSGQLISYSTEDNSELTTLVAMEVFRSKFKKSSFVKLETGDEYCDRNEICNIDLLKIDVEGVEANVMKGFSRMLREGRISVIQFEYGYNNGLAKFLMSDFYSLLEVLDYGIGRLTRRGIEFRSFRITDNDFRSGPNYVAAIQEPMKKLRRF